MTTESWNLKREYFENCNCEVLCPCVVPGPPTDPTEGHCDVGFAFHIQEGAFGDVTLNDLNFVVIAYTPGNMGAGNWTTAVYIDEEEIIVPKAEIRVLPTYNNAGAFWRPRGFGKPGTFASESGQSAAVGIHDVNRGKSIPIRAKCDLRSVRRPRGPIVLGIGVCKPSLFGAIRIHDVNFVLWIING